MKKKIKHNDAEPKNQEVGDVGERLKKLNQQGEQPRSNNPPDPQDQSPK
ncbi:MAG: hypothetical protein JWR17_1521 [Pseudomonas sp.]|jgi:hypothetical protein|nr:hypothetical protein [Pseudomonas sp.]MDB6048775.1 hypothetical protein [Pseudomonas sp.]